MPANDRFFEESKQAQSELKHAILRRYLAKFAGATGTYSPGNRVGYLDGYAGPGVHQTASGVVRPGSPSIALKIAADHAALNRHLECVFIEKKTTYFGSLNAVAAAATTRARAIHGDVSTNIHDAMQDFAGLPALVFLDPFGAAIDRKLTVDAVLQRPGSQPTELLLNFSMQTLRRAGARIWEADNAQGRAKTLERLDSWLGGDWWRQHFLAEMRADEDAADRASHEVATEYARRLCDETGCQGFGVPMRRRAGHKALFILFLIYPRKIATFAFNEAVSLAQEEWRAAMWSLDIEEAEACDEAAPHVGRSYASEMREAQKADAVQFNHDAISDIKKAITDALANTPTLSVANECPKIFGEAIGAGREKHLRAAWKELASEGITCGPPKGGLDRAFITRATLAAA